MRLHSLDLLPVDVKVFDFDDAPELNAALVEAARTHSEFGSSTSGKKCARAKRALGRPAAGALRASNRHLSRRCISRAIVRSI